MTTKHRCVELVVVRPNFAQAMTPLPKDIHLILKKTFISHAIVSNTEGFVKPAASLTWYVEHSHRWTCRGSRAGSSGMLGGMVRLKQLCMIHQR